MTPAARPPSEWIFARAAPAEAPRAGLFTILIATYAALIPYEVMLSGTVKLSPAVVVLACAVLIMPGYLKYRKEVWPVWHWGLVALFAASSLFVALAKGWLTQYVYLNKDLGLLGLMFSYLAITSVLTTWARIRIVVKAFIVSVAIQNLVGIAAFVASNRFGVRTDLLGERGLRLSGLMLDANAYGGLLVTALILCEAACAGREPLFKPAFHWFARATLGLGLAFTFSRSAWISLGLALAVVIVLDFRAGLRTIYALACAGILALILLGTRFLSLFTTMAFRPEVVTGQGRARLDLIEHGLETFGHHPFFGAGIGMFLLREGSIVHNTPIWFLAEFGLVGFTIFCGFMGWFLFKGYQSYHSAPVRERSLVAGLVLAHIAMLGLAMGIEAFYQMYWWLIFALIASSYSVARRRSAL